MSDQEVGEGQTERFFIESGRGRGPLYNVCFPVRLCFSISLFLPPLPESTFRCTLPLLKRERPVSVWKQADSEQSLKLFVYVRAICVLEPRRPTPTGRKFQ